VLRAMNAGREGGLVTVSLTGRTGGSCRTIPAESHSRGATMLHMGRAGTFLP
jgi:hypothetical protein